MFPRSLNQCLIIPPSCQRSISIDSDLCLNPKASEITNLPTKKTNHFWDYSFSHNHGSGNWLYLNVFERELAVSEGPIFFTSMFPGRKGKTCQVDPLKNISGVPAALLDLGSEGDAGWYAKNTTWQI